MPVFDPENDFSVTTTPEAEPAKDTSAGEGHVEETEENAQAPETQEEIEEVNEESTVTQEGEKGKPQPEKLFAGRFPTMGKLINGVNEAARFVGATINWNDLDSPKKIEETYKELQRQISRGEIRNVIQKAQTPEEVKQQVYSQQTAIDQELQKVINASTATLKELEQEPEDQEFYAQFDENTQQILRERDAKLESKVRKMVQATVNLEGAKVLNQIAPIIQHYNNEQEQKANKDLWVGAVDTVEKVFADHGVDDFKTLYPDIVKYFQSHPELYDLVDANPKAKGVRENLINLAYKEVKLEQRLKEFAKTTADTDENKIKELKKGLRSQNGVGGGAANPAKKPSELDKIFGNKNESVGVFG
jgi:small-conductance mechanosensitive channel